MPKVSAHNWSVEYRWSTSSGLVVGPCEYMGVRVLHDLAVPFVYVNYAGDSSGPFTDDSGALIIYEAASREDAEQLLQGDPFHANGIFLKYQLRPWNPVIANRDLLPG